ncbi:phenylacetate--CoA ligase family protein [Victivallis sp. Marseille-Q1083]|uniref:phenylacetate--CoA ligase family protein n=1 Tax=Victivallis sp. Marseille-Q1083 TaxID=2717288 RepID=UPI00158E8368|nr:phenylacetate--CoA ligase [Victivallis sp. Marseille-Q1083]
MNHSHFFQPDAETMSADQLKSRQNEKLKALVRYTAAHSDYFRRRFAAAGVDPESFRGLEDLTSLPTMSKVDFRSQYPLGMCCVAPQHIVEMHMSSGSTGTPVVMPYTLHDVDQWAECMARCYSMAGAATGDVVQITPGFGLFNGGFGLFHGARKRGLFILPCGAGNTVRQIKLAKDFKTRILTAVVSYGTRILEVLEETGDSLPTLEIGIFGAETFTPAMKQRLSSHLGIEVFDIYGMTETGGIGTLGMDCPAHCGIHVWEDHYILEVINPATGRPVPDGELGELVITSLTREALPVIRFRTGDLTRIAGRDRCACGRTHARIESVSGRADDMLIIHGVNFFPGQVEQSLLKIPGVLPNYQLIIEDHHGIKKLHINVEAEPGVTGYMIEKQLKEDLGFSPDGDVYPPGALPRTEGKAKRVFYQNDADTPAKESK